MKSEAELREAAEQVERDRAAARRWEAEACAAESRARQYAAGRDWAAAGVLERDAAAWHRMAQEARRRVAAADGAAALGAALRRLHALT